MDEIKQRSEQFHSAERQARERIQQPYTDKVRLQDMSYESSMYMHLWIIPALGDYTAWTVTRIQPPTDKHEVERPKCHVIEVTWQKNYDRKRFYESTTIEDNEKPTLLIRKADLDPIDFDKHLEMAQNIGIPLFKIRPFVVMDGVTGFLGIYHPNQRTSCEIRWNSGSLESKSEFSKWSAITREYLGMAIRQHGTQINDTKITPE